MEDGVSNSTNIIFNPKDIKTFKLSDLIGLTLAIGAFKDETGGFIYATNVKTKEVYLLKEL